MGGSSSPTHSVVEGAAATPTYGELLPDSLKTASMDHGLQYNAIYWEIGHRTYLPFWASFSQKFNWKLIDDQVRRFFGMQLPVSAEPFVFYGDNAYFRTYHGDPDVSSIEAVKKDYNFALTATGVADPFLPEKRKTNLAASDSFNEIMRSAFKLDCEYLVKKSLSGTQAGLRNTHDFPHS